MGMKPADFYAFVMQMARQVGLDPRRILLGGDYLGPLTFASQPEAEAMENAETLIREYVLAGFTKIHLDTSMRLASDPPGHPPSETVIAERSAKLCQTAQEAFAQRSQLKPDSLAPVYVIGSEVPAPGDAREPEDTVTVTGAMELEYAVECFRKAFLGFCATSLENRFLWGL